MIYQSFLKWLMDMPLKWRLGDGSEIRSRQWPFHSPLTAVVADKTKKELRNSQWKEAAAILGLPPEQAEKIHHASELTVSDGVVFDSEVRHALLTATRITARPYREPPAKQREPYGARTGS